MKLSFFLIYLLGVPYINTSAQEVVTTAGGFAQSANTSLSWTYCELLEESYSKSNIVLAQGMQQPTISITSINEISESTYKVLAFPNPADELITLQVENEVFSGFEYHLTDLNGKVLLQRKIEGNKTVISLCLLPSAVYLIKVVSKSLVIKTFKIVKQ